MRILCVVALLFGTLHSAFAALGDDDEKIDAIYGNIAKRHLRDDGTVSVLYHNDKFYFLVLFRDLHSVSEAYARGDGNKLSKKEISRFLEGNRGASHWPANTLPPDGKLERADHRAEASFIEIDGRLMLQINADIQVGRRPRVPGCAESVMGTKTAGLPNIIE